MQSCHFQVLPDWK